MKPRGGARREVTTGETTPATFRGMNIRAKGNDVTDRSLGFIGILLSAFFIWQATEIELGFISDPIGPRTFPIIVGAVLGLASLAILLLPDAAPEWPRIGRLIEIALAIAVLVAYTLALPEVGFVIATMFASGYLSWRLGARPIAAAIAGVGISLGIYVVFHLILGLTLAKGPLGF